MLIMFVKQMEEWNNENSQIRGNRVLDDQETRIVMLGFLQRMETEGSEGATTDSITELHSLTMSFLKQMEVLLGNDLIMCPKMDTAHPDDHTMDYSNVALVAILLISLGGQSVRRPQEGFAAF